MPSLLQTISMPALCCAVYVLDTGVRTSHVQFSGRVGGGATTVGSSALDDNGHGSHVRACISAARAALVNMHMSATCAASIYRMLTIKPTWATRPRSTCCALQVAGIALATNFGVAPGATLHPVKVMGADGSGAYSNIVSAIGW